MQPYDAAVCFSNVAHHRMFPTRHSFTNKITQIWIDPDSPQTLFDKHPLWSVERFGPIRFKRKDYFDQTGGSITTSIKSLVTEELGIDNLDEVRMVTQPRMWGWLFNPLTIYFIWDKQRRLCAAVLEVTNTPWKQRHFYCCTLDYDDTKSLWKANFAKKLHVSPFLTSDYRYDFTVKEQGDTVLVLLNVIPSSESEAAANEKPILRTVLKICRHKPTKQALSKALYRNAFSTHKTSLGIHYQAMKLWFKRVPFIAHSSKKQGDNK